MNISAIIISRQNQTFPNLNLTQKATTEKSLYQKEALPFLNLQTSESFPGTCSLVSKSGLQQNVIFSISYQRLFQTLDGFMGLESAS
jgi:hypothetical protein